MVPLSWLPKGRKIYVYFKQAIKMCPSSGVLKRSWKLFHTTLQSIKKWQSLKDDCDVQKYQIQTSLKSNSLTLSMTC